MPMLIHDESALVVESVGIIRLASSAFEDESAISAGAPKTKLIGIAEDVEVADFVPSFHHYTISIAMETEGVYSMSREKGVETPEAREAETAGSSQRINPARVCTEQESALQTVWSKGVVAGFGSEIEDSPKMFPEKSPSFVLAQEHEIGRAFNARKRYEVEVASEQEAGIQIDPKFLVMTVFYNGAAASETGIAITIGRAYEQAPASETEIATAGVSAKLSSLSPGVEGESALPAGVGRVYVLGLAQETETSLGASPLGSISRIAGAAVEPESAGGVSLPTLGAYQEITIDKETEMNIDR